MEPTNHHSTSEVGHAKNVANFLDLIEFCVTFGPDYYPAASSRISIAELRNKHAEAEITLQNVHNKRSGYVIAINERQEEFQKLDSFCTRIVNALSVTTNDPRIVADARTFTRKIMGKASKPKTIDNQPGQEVQRPTLIRSSLMINL